MQKVEQVREVNEDGSVAAAERVTRTDVTSAPSSVAARIVWFIAGVIIAVLAIRFVLILLGASTASAFVNFVYSLSYPFAAPFFGIFNYTLSYGMSQFEVSTLVAIAVYALVARGIVRLLTIRRPE